MIAQAANSLGCRVFVLERNEDCPARGAVHEFVLGDGNDPATATAFASRVDVVTIENEFLDSRAIDALERGKTPFWPSAQTLRTVQDKLLQKQALLRAGLAVPRFFDTPDKPSAQKAGADLGWPIVLKRRRLGYDGKGNATVQSASELDTAWAKLDGDRHPLYAEEFCRFRMELAGIVTRGKDGSMASYPIVETVNRDHICHIVRAPAAISEAIAEQAKNIVERTVTALEGVGSFGMELFLREDGAVLVNEIAPRVHNTGHYTIEASECSQFENHARAVLGLPLGSPRLVVPAAVMVNLLAGGDGPGMPQGYDRALAVAGAHVHLYGKSRSQKGRKMGHVTALGFSLEQAEAIAQQAASPLRFGGNA